MSDFKEGDKALFKPPMVGEDGTPAATVEVIIVDPNAGHDGECEVFLGTAEEYEAIEHDAVSALLDARFWIARADELSPRS